jgi:pilus assembly protein Flp/PilA
MGSCYEGRSSAMQHEPLRSQLPILTAAYFQEKTMKNMILKSMFRLHQDEAGQGLVEYALILALVAFAAVVAMQTLAKDINNAFTGIGTILSSYVP